MDKGTIFKFYNDLDTDQIIASQYLLLPNLEEMKAHTFESQDPDFAKKVKPGDYVVAGENFGCGSSREQAPGVLKALGVRLLLPNHLPESFSEMPLISDFRPLSVKIFRMMFRQETPWNFICLRVRLKPMARLIHVPSFRSICSIF